MINLKKRRLFVDMYIYPLLVLMGLRVYTGMGGVTARVTHSPIPAAVAMVTAPIVLSSGIFCFE